MCVYVYVEGKGVLTPCPRPYGKGKGDFFGKGDFGKGLGKGKGDPLGAKGFKGGKGLPWGKGKGAEWPPGGEQFGRGPARPVLFAIRAFPNGEPSAKFFEPFFAELY